MKMYEEINHFKKEYVYERYTRIVPDFKDYDKVTKVKMLDAITRRSQSTDKCFYCSISGGCAWCSGYNYEVNGTPNKRTTFICDMHKARVLANRYYWQNMYHKYNVDAEFGMYCPKDWALEIIPEEEYNMLCNL